VIPLDKLVEVFDLAYLNTSLGLGVVTLYRRCVGARLVDRDLFGCTVASCRFAHKTKRGLAISFCGQQKVHGQTVLSTA
jgi:hypothetical protein